MTHQVQALQQHTPGPWHARFDGGLNNARLIAAAPELLEALHWALEAMTISEVEHAITGQCGIEPIVRARAAIAKATHA